MMNKSEVQVAIVGRDVLAEVLRSGSRPHNAILTTDIGDFKIEDNETIVVWSPWSPRPCAIIVQDKQYDELLSWVNTFHADLAPLTSWCYLFRESQARELRPLSARQADLNGLEAAWIGAITAEAMILSNRSYDNIGLNTCLATASYAAARIQGLYGTDIALASTIYSSSLVISRTKSVSQIRAMRLPIEVLLSLHSSKDTKLDITGEKIADTCRKIHINSTPEGGGENQISHYIVRSFPEVAGIANVSSLSKISAEDRVRLLRALKDDLIAAKGNEATAIKFVAGFLISRIGSGERDLRLAQQFGQAADEVLVWAAIIGGLGVEAYWGAAFAGVGRLIGREVTRPFRIEDAPNCDIESAELSCIERIKPDKTPLFRAASRSAISLGLLPGVSINVPQRESREILNELPAIGSQQSESKNKDLDTEASAALIRHANELFPHLIPLIREEFFSAPKRSQRKNTSSAPLTKRFL